MKKISPFISSNNQIWFVLILFFASIMALPVYGQDPVFTWMKGNDNLTGAVYGIKGVANPANNPGKRYGSIRWTDKAGNFWLFGGYINPFTALNDLWKYDVANNMWTWVSGSDQRQRPPVYGTKGIADPASIPGARRSSISWVDNSGNLWLFGGYGYSVDSTGFCSAGVLSDLWKYDLQASVWTWVGGRDNVNAGGSVYGSKGVADPANIPAGRELSISWTDKEGNFWLFGGNALGPPDFFGGSSPALYNDLWKYDPLTNLWTWVGGGDLPNKSGVYGIKGTADAANIPGSRRGGVSWVDESGILWLFGGFGRDKNSSQGWLNDLWKYDPLTNLWTWVSGSDIRQFIIPADGPRGRESSHSWTDRTGNLWLFGGSIFSGGEKLTDLWKYDPLTGLWTLMKGTLTNKQPGVYGIKGTADAANYPGSRDSGISWTDQAGNFWLFGGVGQDNGNQGYLDELWKYDPSANAWTWAGGSKFNIPFGIYGDLGTAGPDNIPGARSGSMSWKDNSGNLWLFGGVGVNPIGFSFSSDRLNDLWKFTPATNNWTWVGGNAIEGQPGVYGTKGIADPSNIPGARYDGNSWTDNAGNFWLFGGTGFDKNGFSGDLNDLWKYNPATNLWTWVSGSDFTNQPGVYGTKGTADPASDPGARAKSISWTDKAGNLWLFGGFGYDKNGYGYLNDLWKFDPVASLWTWVGGSDLNGEAGIYGIKGTADPANNPGARDETISWTDDAGNLWLFGGIGKDKNGVDGRLNDLWKYDSQANLWTWVGGSDSADQPGVYGTKGVANPNNAPGARYSSVSWTDQAGKVWLFGGYGLDGDGLLHELADLWKYDPIANLWTWAGGPDQAELYGDGFSISQQSGIYGVKGEADQLNLPGARVQGVSWTDSAGNLWLFGGVGYDGYDQELDVCFGNKIAIGLNDLWRISLTDIGLDVGSSALTYGDAPASVPVTGTAGLPVTVTSSDASVFEVAPDAATINIKSAGTATLTATINGTTYSASKEITIAKAALTATAENKSRTYGDSNPALTIAYAGFKNNETASVLDTAPAVTTVATTSSDAGTYAITVSGGSGNNYDLTYVAGTLTINKKAQSITFGRPNEVSETAGTISLSATASSSLSVAFVSADQNKLTISGNTATIKGPGLATVKATQAGNNNYEAAAEVSQSFCILPVKPVITTSGLGSGNTVLTSSTTGNIQWYKDGQPLSGKTSPNLSVEDGGVYSVKCSVDGCATESDVVSLIVTAIGKESEAIRLYPNPAKDELRLTLPESTDGSIHQAEIIDAFGRPVRGQWVNGGEAVFRIEGLAPGHYFIRVTGQKQQVYRRFIKQ